MALFEGYERRVDKINAALKEYGINSIDKVVFPSLVFPPFVSYTTFML